CLQQCNNPLTF
nr:immunoglobulin light chain junction region [Macaca mulatta]MOV80511.1 immunoglobulin light chain junction region [Macaca mulatta]